MRSPAGDLWRQLPIGFALFVQIQTLTDSVDELLLVRRGCEIDSGLRDLHRTLELPAEA